MMVIGNATMQPVNNDSSNFIFDVNLPEFESRVVQASYQQPVLLDLWAEWCSPCLMLAPVLQEIIKAHGGALLLAKVEVDVDENMKLAGRYRVKGFPTIILLQNGAEKARFSGAKPLNFVRGFIKDNLDSQ